MVAVEGLEPPRGWPRYHLKAGVHFHARSARKGLISYLGWMVAVEGLEPPTQGL
jgi:hypothetical protein